MTHRYVALDFAADALGPSKLAGGRAVELVISNGKVSCAIALGTGIATPVAGVHVRAQPEPALQLGDVVERASETARGPWTELLAAGTDAPLASFGGQLIDAARSGALLVATVAVPGPRYDVVAMALDGGDPLRLPGAYWGSCAAGGPFAIAANNGLAHVFRLGPDGSPLRLSSVTVALPPGRPVARIVGSEALIVAATKLVILDLESLPFDRPHRSIALTLTAVAGSARGLLKPGVVVAIVGKRILVDHPDVRRITIERTPDDPAVQAGDRIQIDDVREPMPGILKVHAWSKVGGPPRAAAAGAPIVLDAPPVVPIAESIEPGAASQDNARSLRTWAERWPFRAPPALEHFLTETDRDPVLRRWLGRLGMESFEVMELSRDWDADPCLLAFAGNGGGDAYAVYLYPPALEAEEPLVVMYLHETNEVEILAHTMDDFLVRHFDHASEHSLEIAELARARLGVPRRSLAPPTAPPWLPQRVTPAPALADARALRERGDRQAAERAYLRIYLDQGPQGREARDALLALYEELGWPGPLAALRASVD